MATFKLDKGSKFAIDKGITDVIIGLGWDVAKGKTVDVDAHAFGCIVNAAGNPSFYNDASHALTYANKGQLKSNPNKSFETMDGSLHHSGDDRSGGNSASGDDETITVNLNKLPVDITEVSIWITIHEPKQATFSDVNNAFVHLVNKTTGEELCKYVLTNEFATSHSVQVGSLFKKDNIWTFHAIGAGLDNVGLGEILEKLS